MDKKILLSRLNAIFIEVFDDDTISLSEDWNLISGISVSVPLEAIYDPSGIIIPNTIYGYNSGYFLPENIEPGNGYWLRSFGSGEIIFSSSVRLKVREPISLEPEDANTLTLGLQTLYFGNEIQVVNPLSYSLPPSPPVGGKDIRFSGDTKLCTSDECVIELMNDDNPLTFEIDIRDGEEWELASVVSNKIDWNGEIFLFGQNQFTLNPNVEQIILRKSKPTLMPREFVLFPAHPNPFNPETIIQFSVGVELFDSGVSSSPSATSLQIYDITGKLVKTLVNEKLVLGNHTVKWNASGIGITLFRVPA